MEEKFRLEIEQLTNPDLIEETEEYYSFKKEDWNKFLEKLQECIESKEEKAFEAGSKLFYAGDGTTRYYKTFQDYKKENK